MATTIERYELARVTVTFAQESLFYVENAFVGKHPPSKTQNATSASSLARDAHLASAFAERPARATEEIFFKASTCGSARGIKDAEVRIRAFFKRGDGLQ